MIEAHQQRYLDTIPDDGRLATIYPFDPKTQVVAKSIIQAIGNSLPDAQIIYQGSTALGIAGENDIDLSIIFPDFQKALDEITELCGKPKQVNTVSNYAHWDFILEGFPVDMGLQQTISPSLKEQIETQKLLENNEDLRREYEMMKLNSNQLPLKQYLMRKYEFWNKISVRTNP